MLPITMTLGPLAAASANWFVTSVTPTSGTALTLAHSSVVTPRRVLVTFGNEASDRTLRLTGTNADGNPIRETLTVPNGAGGTTYTTQDFATLTEAMPLDGGWTAAMTLGTNTIASTPWKLTNWMHQAVSEITWYGEITAGSGTWTVQWTADSINDNQNSMGGALGNYPTPPTALDLATLTAKATSASASQDNPIQAWRLVLTGTTPFAVKIRALEGGFSEAS